MKKITAAVITALLALSATSCGYNENYRATCLVSSEGNNRAYQSFSEFEGTRVLDLRNSDPDKDTLYYTASLEQGSISVYIDYDGTKRDLFDIEGGEEIEASLQGLDLSKVYIIIETDGNCIEGDLDFEIGS